MSVAAAEVVTDFLAVTDAVDERDSTAEYVGEAESVPLPPSPADGEALFVPPSLDAVGDNVKVAEMVAPLPVAVTEGEAVAEPEGVLVASGDNEEVTEAELVAETDSEDVGEAETDRLDREEALGNALDEAAAEDEPEAVAAAVADVAERDGMPVKEAEPQVVTLAVGKADGRGERDAEALPVGDGVAEGVAVERRLDCDDAVDERVAVCVTEPVFDLSGVTVAEDTPEGREEADTLSEAVWTVDGDVRGVPGLVDTAEAVRLSLIV